MTALIAALLLATGGCASLPDDTTTRESAEQMLRSSFTAPSSELLGRLQQDRSQAICSKPGAPQLAQPQAEEVARLARESFKYPSSGQLVGDWKLGEQLAHDGAGDRIAGGRLEARKHNGGLCQNCHELEPGEINVGNIGPSLTAYGTQRGNSAEMAKYTYEKIYNGWAYIPCSNMPRLGANGHLQPEQIAHLVAYLLDPRSPVNRR